MLKGTEWIATGTQFFIAGWNTGLLKKGDQPKQFEDFADPKWKGKLIAEPRDFQLLMGLAKRKYKSDEKAVELLKKIAANGVEFHKGHSQLVELLVAGQAPVCLTCSRRREHAALKLEIFTRSILFLQRHWIPFFIQRSQVTRPISSSSKGRPAAFRASLIWP